MLGWSVDDIKQFISIIEHTTSFTAANIPGNERPYEESFKFLLEKGIINISSGDIPYDNTNSGLTAEDVQAALDELKQIIDDLEASDIAVVPSGSLVDTDVQAALQTIYGAVDLTKNRLTTLENGKLRITYYEIIDISATTSGTITKPTGATIIENQFGDSGNSVLSTLTGANTPSFQSPEDGASQSITANLDVNGNYVASNTYASPVALLYVIEVSYLDYINNVNKVFVIDNVRIDAMIPDHNDLGGIQGGAINEYYHLTAIELALLASAIQPGDNVSALVNDAGYLTSGGGGGLQSWAFAISAQTNATAYARVGAFPFPGTAVIPTISKINGILRKNNGATSISARIYDITNAQVIAEVTGIINQNDTVITSFGSVSNLPIGEAVFEIQLLRVGAGNGRAFISGIEIRL